METIVPAGDVTAVVAYSHRTFAQAIRSCTAAKLAAMNMDPASQENFVQIFKELTDGPGDTIKWDLIPNAQGPGVRGDSVIAGSEVPFTALQDTMTIDQIRQSHLLNGVMSQQRVPYSMRNAAKTSLANWFKEYFDYGLGNQLGGNTNVNTSTWTNSFAGNNNAIAPSSDHWYLVNKGTVAASGLTEADLGPTDTFSIEMIPQLVSMAQTFPMPIKPVMVNGMEVTGILFLTPQMVRDMKRNYTPGEWGNLMQYAYMGQGLNKNPIFNGALGMHDGVIIHQDAHFPWGDDTQNKVTIVNPDRTTSTRAAPNSLGAASTSTTNIHRGVFVGAQALAMAFGAFGGPDGQPLKVRWVEELLDAGNQLRVTAGMILGMKKTVFPALTDYATVVVSAYATP